MRGLALLNCAGGMNSKVRKRGRARLRMPAQRPWQHLFKESFACLLCHMARQISVLTCTDGCESPFLPVRLLCPMLQATT